MQEETDTEQAYIVYGEPILKVKIQLLKSTNPLLSTTSYLDFIKSWFLAKFFKLLLWKFVGELLEIVSFHLSDF